jgi:hypothetical protein
VMDLPTAENIKNSKLALIAGLLIGLSLGAGGAWTASTTIHAAQFKVLSAVNEDLQRQVSEFRDSSQAKDAEMSQLREQLSVLSPERREADTRRRRELETFIRSLDQEIAQKKKEGPKRWAQMQFFTNPSFSSGRPVVNDCPPPPEKREKSAFEIRYEREPASLSLQRDEARRKLIELIAK